MDSKKPLGQKSYGHIPHLPYSRLGAGDHKCADGQADIALKKARDRKDLVICQEKLDGSNVAIAKIGGRIIPLGRSGYLAETSKFEQHQYFAKWVYQHVDRFDKLLDEGERICGEWLMQAHGTKYKLPHEPFVPFDIMKGIERMPYHDFLLRVLPFGFTIPRLLHIGQPFPLEKALEAIKVSGHGAIDEVEGVVYRVERENKVDFLCKYVKQNKIDGVYLPEMNEGITYWNIKPEDLFAADEGFKD